MRIANGSSCVTALLLTSMLAALSGCQYLPWRNGDRKRTSVETAAAPAAATAPAAAAQPASPAPTDDPAVAPSTAAAPTKTLYERLGGEKAIRAVVDDFVARAADNPNVNFSRQGTSNEWQPTPENVEKLKVRLVEFIGTATGGPQKYQGQDMVTAHKGMQITEEEFEALAADLTAALERHRVPPAEQKELLDLVGSTRGAIVEKQPPQATTIAPR